MGTAIKRNFSILFLMMALFSLSGCFDEAPAPPQIETSVTQAVDKTESYFALAEVNDATLTEADDAAPAIASEWALFTDNGSFFLKGFTLYEGGTGILWHNWEGGFKITSYALTDDQLAYTFINMGDEEVAWEVNLSELMRVASIEPEGLETYLITFMDGRTEMFSMYDHW